MVESTPKFGKFEFRPLEPGFGITIGNALRRILLSSLEGFAINVIRIEGVEHEFATIPGVKEDVTNIILNLKQVRFKQIVEEVETEKVCINVEKTTEFRILNQYYADKLLGKDEPLKFVKLQDGYGGNGRKKPRQMKFEISGIVLADDYGTEFPAYSNGNPTTDKDLPAHFLPTMYGIKLGKRVDLDF